MQETISLFALFKLGGAVMWPLLLLLVAATAIIIDRIVFLIKTDRKPMRGAETACEILRTQGTGPAAAFCTEPRRIWGTAMAIALDRNGGKTSSIALAKAQTEETLQGMERPLTYLDLIASISPILGFLGTVTGMIAAFKAISEANTVQLQVVAAGLYEALFTTAFGLS